MDNRRMIITVLVSVSLLFGWYLLSEQMGWIPNRSATSVKQETTPAQPLDQTQGHPAAQSAQPGQYSQYAGGESYAPADSGSRPAGGAVAPASEIVVDTPLYTAKFNSLGGILTSFELKNYTVYSEYKIDKPRNKVQMISPEAAAFAPLGVLINNQHSWRNAVWTYESSSGGSQLNIHEGESGSLTFTGQLSGLTLKRVISFDPSTYVLREQLLVFSDQAQAISLGYSLSTGNLAGPDDYQRINRVARLQGGSFSDTDSTSDLTNGQDFGGNISWGGNMSNYFLAAMMPSDPSFRMEAKLQSDVYTVAMKNDSVQLLPETPARSEMNYYFGPKQKDALMAAPNELISSVDYGWFGFIAKPLMAMLKFFHSFVGNWGVAIILLTVVVKIVLWPLSYKSYKSMQSMKLIQPHMAKIRERHKEDKQRMNQEMMQLYRTYKINPMGGCLPILVQLPVFVGLYKALLNAFELRQAGFIPYLPFTDIVWLADLSLSDPIYITPLIMGASMFVQQRLTPAMGDPTQQKVMMFMPIIFTIMFLNFPAGLVVYWLVNNLISIGQQQWQMRYKSAVSAPLKVESNEEAAEALKDDKESAPKKAAKRASAGEAKSSAAKPAARSASKGGAKSAARSGGKKTPKSDA